MSDTETRTFTSNGSRSAGELMKEITEDLSTLVRKEVELARSELGASIAEKVKGGVIIAIVGVFALLALLFALLAVRDAVALWLPEWAADLITAAALLVLGSMGAVIAKKKLSAPIEARLTKETIKEDIQWAKTIGRQ